MYLGVDGDAEGVHALPWMCQESQEAHLQDGRLDFSALFSSIYVVRIIRLAVTIFFPCNYKTKIVYILFLKK